MVQTTAPMLIRAENITKRYGSVIALEDVSVNFRSGEIVGLLGHNGAGKSTLVKILTGDVRPDGGQVIVGETLVSGRWTPRDALANGVICVYQDGGLSPGLSLVENTWLMMEGASKGTRVTCSEVEKALRDTARQVFPDTRLDFKRAVRDFSSASYQLGELCRALAILQIRRGMLILDEATAAIGARDAQSLYRWLRRNVVSMEVAVLVISHRISELVGQTDRTIIMRNGHVVAEEESAMTTRDRLVSLMSGSVDDHNVFSKVSKLAEQATDQGVVAVSSGHSQDMETDPIEDRTKARRRRPMTRRGNRSDDGREASLVEIRWASGGPRQRGSSPKAGTVNLEISSGEMVGIGGLIGQGQEEFLESLVLSRPVRGAITWRCSGRVGFVSGDRRAKGVLPISSVAENLCVSSYRLLQTLGIVTRRSVERLTQSWVDRLEVRCGTLDASIGSLSGGNQQKVLIARALASEPDLLVLDDPTRGVDPETKFEVLDILRQFVSAGGAVLWYSTEPDELLACDRVYVFLAGRPVAQLSGTSLNEQALIEKSFHT